MILHIHASMMNLNTIASSISSSNLHFVLRVYTHLFHLQRKITKSSFFNIPYDPLMKVIINPCSDFD